MAMWNLGGNIQIHCFCIGVKLRVLIGFFSKKTSQKCKGLMCKIRCVLTFCTVISSSKIKWNCSKDTEVFDTALWQQCPNIRGAGLSSHLLVCLGPISS